jgi:hypothetical protein
MKEPNGKGSGHHRPLEGSVAFVIAAVLAVSCGVSTPSEVPADSVAVVSETPITKAAFGREFESRLTGISPLADRGDVSVLDAPGFEKCTAEAGRVAARACPRPPRAELIAGCRGQYQALRLSVVSKLIEGQWAIQAGRHRDALLGERRAARAVRGPRE